MLQYSNKAITMVDVIHLIPIPKTNVHVHPSAVTHPEQLVGDVLNKLPCKEHQVRAAQRGAWSCFWEP